MNAEEAKARTAAAIERFRAGQKEKRGQGSYKRKYRRRVAKVTDTTKEDSRRLPRPDHAAPLPAELGVHPDPVSAMTDRGSAGAAGILKRKPESGG